MLYILRERQEALRSLEEDENCRRFSSVCLSLIFVLHENFANLNVGNTQVHVYDGRRYNEPPMLSGPPQLICKDDLRFSSTIYHTNLVVRGTEPDTTGN